MGAAVTESDPPGADPPADAPTRLLHPRTILRQYGIRPKRRLGQHFLVDPVHLTRILQAADLRSTDRVLEIGPGLGVLTDALAARAGSVVAVEVDAAMREVLMTTGALHGNVRVVAGDFLSSAPEELLGLDAACHGRLQGYKVVANLPYQITSAALRHMLEARVIPERVVVMLQREVGERIMARPGAMSILAVSVQYYGRPSLVSSVPAAAFYPRPKVDSVVLRLDTYSEPPVDVPDAATLFRVVRAGFSQKRKQLRNSLASGLELSTSQAFELLQCAGVDPRRRAQTLALDEWAALARAAVGTASPNLDSNAP